MGLTRLAIYRPVVALTIFVAIALGGFLSFRSLGLDQAPELNLPIVTVQIPYPGASAETVEQQVTRRVEDAIATLGDIDTMTSWSSDGLAVITVEFKEHINKDIAATDVQQKVQGVRRDLPAEIEEPSYFKVDFNDVPILYLALTNESGYGSSDLYRLADEVVRRRIEAVDGVGRVVLVGGREPEVQVRVSPERLRAYGLGFADVTDAVREQYVTAAGGDVRTTPSDGGRATALRVESRQTSVEGLGAVAVASRDGFQTELRNIADVYSGGEEPEQYVRFNGQLALGLLVYKQSSANITRTADAVLPVVEQLRAELPAGLGLEVAIDRTSSIRSSVEDMEHELALAAILAGIVLLLFLHTPRATIIVLLAIPTSLAVAAIAMKVLDLTLNTMTLIGLTTSIGILVDDSIVVLENIFKHLEEGEEPKQAALKGRSEIGLAAIAITLIDVAVYGPILFVSGLTGAFIRNFAVVIVVATLASLLVSFTLTPLLASRWLSLNDQRSLIARLASAWEPAYRWLERAYGVALGWALHHRPLVILAAAGLLFASFRIVPLLGSEFVPEVDERIIYVTGELPAGTTLDAADRAARAWEAALLDHDRFPEIHKIYTVVGRGDSDLETNPRYISLSLDIESRGHRQRRGPDIRRDVIEAGLAAVPEMQAHIGGQRAGGTGQQLQVRLFGEDLNELARWARIAQAELEANPKLQDVSQSMVTSPELVVRPDPRRVQDFGLNTRVVADAVRAAYQGVVPARYVEPSGKERDIRVRLPEGLRYDGQGVRELPLAMRGNTLVTVEQVADLEQRGKPVRILRVNRERAAQLGAEPNGVQLGEARTSVTEQLASLGLPASIRVEFAGQSKEQAKSFAQLGMALGIAVLLEYLVLIILYESVILPLVILSALPLSLIGTFAGLWLFSTTLSVPSFIGIIALFGLVGKNSILLVDRIQHLRKEQGLPREAAIRQAGPDRLRPILMTSLVLVVGLLPVALKLGEGGEIRAPLAAVLVGGMSTSTLLSLLFVPVSYTYFDTLAQLPGRASRAVRRWMDRVPSARGRRRAAPTQAPVAATAAATPDRSRGAAWAPMAGGELPITVQAAADHLDALARQRHGAQGHDGGPCGTGSGLVLAR